MRKVGITASLAVALLFGCSDSDTNDDLAAVQAALDAASPGDTVRIGPVRITGGTIHVPAGVTLAGSGDADTIVVAPTDSVAIVLHAETTFETRTTGLRILSDGTAAMLVAGAGSARIDNISVESTRGIGIGAEGVANLRIEDVSLTGPVTPENAAGMPLDPGPADTGTHGIVLVDVGNANLARVQADGYALFGALFVNSGVTWIEGGAEGNLGTNLMAWGGSSTLDAIQLCGSLQGGRLIPAYGSVFTSGVVVDTAGITICDGGGYGMLHAGAEAHHANLVATGNANAAVWVQDNTDIFAITGTASRIADNNFAGIVIVDSQNASVSDATVENTHEMVRLSSDVGMVRVGDGIQLLRSTSAVTLNAVTVRGNERAGVLLDLDGGTTAGITLDGVTADATGAAYGAIAQNGTLVGGWDTGITRTGAAATNDPGFIAAGIPLDVVGVVAPTDMPTATSLASMGLEAIGVVAPTD